MSLFSTTTVTTNPEEKPKLGIETGIKDGRVVFRMTQANGLVTDLTFSPEYAREVARQLNGQADIADPPKAEKIPGGCADTTYDGMPPKRVRKRAF